MIINRKYAKKHIWTWGEEHAENSISINFLWVFQKLSCVIIMCGNNNNNSNSNIPISITFLQTLMNILYSLWIIEIICINIVNFGMILRVD